VDSACPAQKSVELILKLLQAFIVTDNGLMVTLKSRGQSWGETLRFAPSKKSGFYSLATSAARAGTEKLRLYPPDWEVFYYWRCIFEWD